LTEKVPDVVVDDKVDGFINWDYYSKIGVSISASSSQKETTMKNRQTFYSQSNDRPTEEESDDESSDQTTSTMDRPPDLFIPDGPPSLDIPGGDISFTPSKSSGGPPSMDVKKIYIKFLDSWWTFFGYSSTK
jgi:hypothetical protein